MCPLQYILMGNYITYRIVQQSCTNITKSKSGTDKPSRLSFISKHKAADLSKHSLPVSHLAVSAALEIR